MAAKKKATRTKQYKVGDYLAVFMTIWDNDLPTSSRSMGIVQITKIVKDKHYPTLGAKLYYKPLWLRRGANIVGDKAGSWEKASKKDFCKYIYAKGDSEIIVPMPGDAPSEISKTTR